MTLAVVGFSGFFVVLSFVLLVRYRQISQRISTSSDLGHDLWQALDSRLRKQDERILDMMGRFEVIQSRVVGKEPAKSFVTPVAVEEAPVLREGRPPSAPVIAPKTPAPHDQGDNIARVVLRLLAERPRTSVEIKGLVGKSREHSARLMKNLFERGLVVRDDSKRPFVYQLTDDGRRYLSAG